MPQLPLSVCRPVTFFSVFHPGFFRNAKIHGTRGAALAAESDILGVLKQVAAVLTGDPQAGVVLPDGTYVAHPFYGTESFALDVETYGATKKEAGDCRVAEFVCAAMASLRDTSVMASSTRFAMSSGRTLI